MPGASDHDTRMLARTIYLCPQAIGPLGADAELACSEETSYFGRLPDGAFSWKIDLLTAYRRSKITHLPRSFSAHVSFEAFTNSRDNSRQLREHGAIAQRGF